MYTHHRESFNSASSNMNCTIEFSMDIINFWHSKQVSRSRTINFVMKLSHIGLIYNRILHMSVCEGASCWSFWWFWPCLNQIHSSAIFFLLFYFFSSKTNGFCGVQEISSNLCPPNLVKDSSGNVLPCWLFWGSLVFIESVGFFLFVYL